MPQLLHFKSTIQYKDFQYYNYDATDLSRNWYIGLIVSFW